MALLSQQLPNMLFGFPAGAFADRFDRRRIIAGVNLGRAAVLAVLAWTISGRTVNIAVVLLALFVLGTAEIFADVASGSLPPQVVRREDLGIANARLTSSYLLTNHLLGRRSAPSSSASAWRCRSRRTPRASPSAPCLSRVSRPTSSIAPRMGQRRSGTCAPR
jgi:MFS family permease